MFLIKYMGLHSLNNDTLLSLVTHHTQFFEYVDPSISPNGNFIAWTARCKFENEYFDPADNNNPMIVHPSAKGTKIYIWENGLDRLVEISTEGKSCWSPTWSPDGTTLAYYSDADGACELWLYDLKEQKSRKASSIPIGFQLPTQKLIWSKDGHEIYAFMTSKKSIEDYEKYKSKFTSSYHSEEICKSDYRYLDLVAIDVETGTWRLLSAKSDAQLASFLLSQSGRWLAFLDCKNTPSVQVHGHLTELGIVSSDGTIHCSIMDSIPEPYGFPIVYAWHPFLDHLYFLVDHKIWVAKFSEEGLASCHPICSEVDCTTLAFTKDGNFLVAGLDPVENLALIACNKEEIEILRLPQNWVFDQLVKNSENLLWQANPNTISYLANNKEDTESAIIRLDVQSGKEEILWQGDDIVSFFGFNHSHDLLFGMAENFKSPKELVITDGEFKSRKVISNTWLQYNDLKGGTVEFFETDVLRANGEIERVQTAIILPPGTKKGDKLPAIVVHYPGLDAAGLVRLFGGSDLIGGVPNWLFTNDHFALILPNLILGEEAVGKPLETMTNRLLPQVYEAGHLGYIDIERVGIIGQSYGGYGTAGMISHTNLFKAAVAINGVYDLASFAYHLDSKGGNFWMSWAELSQGNMGQNLYEDLSRYIDNSPFYRADKIQTPLLIIHGKLDDAVTDAGKLFSALRRLKKEAELVLYEKGHHVIGEMRQEDHLDALKRILAFFHRHLNLPVAQIDSN